jgi:pyridoxamine 5'-phosphate oxidase
MIALYNMRREYQLHSLDENAMDPNPIEMFSQWLQDAITAKVPEPNAMSLATASSDGKPSLRVVLLKEIVPGGFIFFTNYESQKGRQLDENAFCALNFNWLEIARQVRIEGVAEKISDTESDKYFVMRPNMSQLSAWASPQSQIIPNRQYLEDLMIRAKAEHAENPITRPANWGGYLVKPQSIEFWQGRANRLHDRIKYTLNGDCWSMNRLAP